MPSPPPPRSRGRPPCFFLWDFSSVVAVVAAHSGSSGNDRCFFVGIVAVDTFELFSCFFGIIHV